MLGVWVWYEKHMGTTVGLWKGKHQPGIKHSNLVEHQFNSAQLGELRPDKQKARQNWEKPLQRYYSFSWSFALCLLISFLPFIGIDRVHWAWCTLIKLQLECLWPSSACQLCWPDPLDFVCPGDSVVPRWYTHRQWMGKVKEKEDVTRADGLRKMVCRVGG